MKKFLLDYINLIGYVVTILVFSIAVFVLLVNFYHYKDVNTVYTKPSDSKSAYESNKSKIEEIKDNVSVYNPNDFKSNPNNLVYMNVKSRLDQCVDKYTVSDVNKIFDKKVITVKDDYDLLTAYQNDIINGCIIMNIYSMDIPKESFQSVKPFITSNSKLLMNDTDYVKRTLQNNSSYSFGTKFDKTNVFDLTRDSYTRIESSYNFSVDFVLEVSRWFKNFITGGDA